MYDAERTRVTASSPWLRIHEFITAEPTTPCPCVDCPARTHALLSQGIFRGNAWLVIDVPSSAHNSFEKVLSKRSSFEIEHFHKLGGRIISGEVDQFHRLTFQIRWNRRKMIGFSSRREINSDYEIDPKARI